MPVLEKAGLDVAALEKILRQEKRTPRTPERAIERHAAMKTSVVRNMNALAARRARGSPFQPTPHPNTPAALYVVLADRRPSSVKSRARRQRVQAQLDTSDGDDGPDGGGQYVSFVYVWNNATGSDANVDVDTSLGFLGYCSVQTFGG